MRRSTIVTNKAAAWRWVSGGALALPLLCVACGTGESLDGGIDGGSGSLPVEWKREVLRTSVLNFDAIGGFGRVGLLFSSEGQIVSLDGEGMVLATGDIPDVFEGPQQPHAEWAAFEEGGGLRLGVNASGVPVQEILLDEELNLVESQESGCRFHTGAGIARSEDTTWIVHAIAPIATGPELSLCSLAAAGVSGPEQLETGTGYSIDGRGLAVLDDGRLLACVTRPPYSGMAEFGWEGEILVIDPAAASGPSIVNRYSIGPEFIDFTCELIRTPAGIAAIWNSSTAARNMDVSAALISSADGSLLVGPTFLDNNYFAPWHWVHHNGHLYGLASELDGHYMLRVDAATLAVKGKFLFVPAPDAARTYKDMAVSDGTSLFAVELRQTGSGQSFYLTKVGAFDD